MAQKWFKAGPKKVQNFFFFYFDLTGVPHVNAITMLGMPQVIQGIPVDIH